jgi:polysaccharide export outer membrane protein
MRPFSIVAGIVLIFALSASAQTEFRLGAGDEIQIDVLGEPDLVRTFTILPDGTITFPYLEAFRAAGMTPQELDNYLTQALGEYLIRPEVTVTLRTLNSKRIFVFGEVNQEGAMVLTQKTRLIEALALAGSFNRQTANLAQILLLREEEGERRAHTHNVKNFLTAGGDAGDVLVQPGDVLYVPTKIDVIYVFGEVVDPGVHPYDQGLTALSAVGRARGFLDSAARHSVVVIRDADSPNPQHFRLDLLQATKKGILTDNIVLKPGDVVFVPKKFISEVGLWVRQWLTDVGRESMSFAEQSWNLQNLYWRTKILKNEAKNPTGDIILPP